MEAVNLRFGRKNRGLKREYMGENRERIGMENDIILF